MSAYYQMHSSPGHRLKHAATPIGVTPSHEEDEVRGHRNTPELQPEEPPTRPAEKCVDMPTRVDDALRLGYTTTSPIARHAVKEVPTSTRGVVPIQRYMAVSTSDSIGSTVVFHPPDRAVARMVSELLSVSEHKSLSRCASSVKIGTDTVNMTLVEEDDDDDDAEDRNTENDKADDNVDGDVVMFELYKPTEMRRPENAFSGGSPLPSVVLRMRFPTGGASERRCSGSNGSREQASGRYLTLSQSSRLEDAHRLASRGGEICKSSNSSIDSFSVVGAGTAFQCSGQPQRMESSMNSQLFHKSTRLRNAMNAPLVRGGSRYDSVRSPCESTQVSADVAAPTVMNFSGPHLLSSDQMALFSHSRGHNRHKHANHLQLRQNRCHCDGSVEADGTRQLDGIVLGMASVDPLTGDGEAAMASSLSPTDGFELVRAPITGLRAMVLGNDAVEEEEAAEDPEMRELQSEQLKRFCSKVVRQHRDGAERDVSAHGNLPPTSTTSVISTLQTQQALCMDAIAADSVALGHEVGVPPFLQSPALRDDGQAAQILESVLANKLKKRGKKVMFNMNGMEPHDTEGGGAAQLPHRSNPQSTCVRLHREPSPLALQCGVARRTPSSDQAEVPNSVDEAVPVLLLQAPLGRGAPSLSVTNTPRRADKDDDHPLTPLLPSPKSATLMQQQQQPASAEILATIPLHPVPPSATLAQLSVFMAEDPRKRLSSVGKMSEISKRSCIATVARLEGTGDAIGLRQSSNFLSCHTRSYNSHLAPPNVLSSVEVCLPVQYSSKKERTQQHPAQRSTGSASPVHRIEQGGRATSAFMSPSLHTAQVVPEQDLASAPTQPAWTTTLTLTTAAAGLATAKRNERKEKAYKKSRRDATHKSTLSFPIVKSHVVEKVVPQLPTTPSIRPPCAESPREWASAKPSLSSFSGDEVSLMLPPALERRFFTSHGSAATVVEAGAVVGSARASCKRRKSDAMKSRTSMVGDPAVPSSRKPR
ncbi:hypothetical protein MNV84_07195 [Leishmania braziliensis]|nr:hypothetical protein MNV84_07195 [Leishmania braziliensis]